MQSKSDTVKLKKERLNAVVFSKAENTRNDVRKKMTYLNTNAQVKYEDWQIDADYIQIDWDANTVYALFKFGVLDCRFCIFRKYAKCRTYTDE